MNTVRYYRCNTGYPDPDTWSCSNTSLRGCDPSHVTRPDFSACANRLVLAILEQSIYLLYPNNSCIYMQPACIDSNKSQSSGEG